jgi:hypothetical protein
MAVYGAVEHPEIIRHVLGVAAAAHLKKTEEDTPEKITSINLALAGEVAQHEALKRRGISGMTPNGIFSFRSVPQGVGELFAYRLTQTPAMQAAGLRVPEVRLTDEPLGAGWFSKPVDGGWCNSRRIARTIPIFYLNDERPAFMGEWEHILHHKECPVARSEYGDFPAELEDNERVRSVVHYSSPQRLLQYAFRALLYATYPHNSNALVEVSGDEFRLWLIDHDKILMAPERGDDIAGLYSVVQHFGPALDACKQVSQISELDLVDALSDIPAQFWAGTGKVLFGEFQSSRQALPYFVHRLRLWQELFGFPAQTEERRAA